MPTRRTTDFTEIVVCVTRTGGFLVHSVFYSAPSRLIGKRLRVHVYDDRIEAFLGATPVVSHPRQRGRDDGVRVAIRSSTASFSYRVIWREAPSVQRALSAHVLQAAALA